MLEGIKPVLRIQKDLFRIQLQLRIFRVPDPAQNFPSSGYRQKFRIYADPDPILIDII